MYLHKYMHEGTYEHACTQVHVRGYLCPDTDENMYSLQYDYNDTYEHGHGWVQVNVLGYFCVPVRVQGCFHLDSACNCMD